MNVMKSIEDLNKEIRELTDTIEEKHPELHQFLSETPGTIPGKPGEQVTVGHLEKHLETLQTVLKHYLETKALK